MHEADKGLRRDGPHVLLVRALAILLYMYFNILLLLLLTLMISPYLSGQLPRHRESLDRWYTCVGQPAAA